ncbi:MAG: hypothetical protein Q7V61_09505 [Actinomycetota bacterium]|nr:hypothetical protein [Actinomycetota bacterium]
MDGSNTPVKQARRGSVELKACLIIVAVSVLLSACACGVFVWLLLDGQSGRGAFYMVPAGAIESGLTGDGSTEASAQPVPLDPADLNPPVSWDAVPEKVQSSGDWKVISTGHHHGVGIKTDGTLWAWGRLTEIQEIVGYDHAVRVGEDSDWVRVQADQTGIDSTYATKRDGTVWVLRHK